MKKKNQKLVALALAFSMMFGTALPAYAADAEEGTSSGTGSVEGVVSTDVFEVVVPAESDGAFDFILDPQGLIAATVEDESSDYNGKTFEAGKNLFFPNAEDADIEYTASNDYSSKSNPLEIMNKSTIEVNVTLTATVDADSLSVGEDTEKKSATLVESDTFAEDDTSASIYLALSVVGEDEATAITDKGATVKAKLDGAAEDVYTIQLKDGEYVYAIDETVVTPEADHATLVQKFDSMQFQLTGACNANGDWTGLEELAPKVSVTWKVDVKPEPGVEDVSCEATSSVATDQTTTIVFPEGATKITKIMCTMKGATTATALALNTHYSVSDTTLTLKAAHIKLVAAKGSAEYTVTFDNGATATFTTTVTAPSN